MERFGRAQFAEGVELQYHLIIMALSASASTNGRLKELQFRSTTFLFDYGA